MNLWPDDIAYTDLRSPMDVLKEQASALGERTKNLVLAEVEEGSISETMMRRIELKIKDAVKIDKNNFIYNFNIVAPALNNYRYRLFTVIFGITLYPVEFYLDEDIRSQLYSEQMIPVANSESELMNMLKDIFNSTKSKQIIHALLAQSGGLS